VPGQGGAGGGGEGAEEPSRAGAGDARLLPAGAGGEAARGLVGGRQAAPAAGGGEPAVALRAAAGRLQQVGAGDVERRRRADRPGGGEPGPSRLRDGGLERLRDGRRRHPQRRGRGGIAPGVPAGGRRVGGEHAVAGSGQGVGGTDGAVLPRPGEEGGPGRGAAAGAAAGDRRAARRERGGAPVLLGRVHADGAVIWSAARI